MGIRNPWLAYQFDETVQLFGLRVENRLAQCKDRFQRDIAFREVLELPTVEKKINLGRIASMGGGRIRTAS